MSESTKDYLRLELKYLADELPDDFDAEDFINDLEQ